MWPPVNPLWKVCLESLCRLWESLWKLRKMVNLEHLLYWRISPSLLLESAPFFVKNWLLKRAKKFWFCDRALVFQPEIKSALTGCIPISLPSISGLEPFVEEHNKWKWKVNIANGTMDPTLSVRLSRIKRSLVISLVKIWPHSISFLLWFWAHDYVSNFFETLCMNEAIYAPQSSSWWSASWSDLTLEMMHWVTGYHPFVMRGLRRCTRDAWREGSTLKITITFYCSCTAL